MDKPRNFLHVIGRLDGYGGARLLRRLAAQQRSAGRRVTVAAARADSSIVQELAAAGVDVVRLNAHWAIDPAACWQLRRTIRRLRPSIVHAWDACALATVVLASRTRRSRLVATLRAADLAHALIRRFIARADAIAVADSRAQATVQRWGAAEERLIVVPPGVLPAASSPVGRAELLDHIGRPRDSRLIAVAGPLLRGKQLDEAIWCFELLRVLHTNAVLLVVGDGPDYERLERFAELVTEPGSVRLLGYRHDIAAILPHADVYWQLTPSTATPLALLEAEAAGVPVVATDLPAHRTAISHGSTGFLVPLNDRAEVVRASDALLNDAELAARVSGEARAQVARHWSLENALDAYGRLYD